MSSRYTSLSSRLVLAKAGLCSSPIYLMSIFKAPVGVVGEIEKIIRTFIWGKGEGSKKVSWIPWMLICQSKELGRLGLGFIGWKNKALLLKWAWRVRVELKSLWRKVITSKYNLDIRILQFYEMLSKRLPWSSLLHDIINSLKEDSLLSKGFKEGILCKVGD